MTLFGTSGIRGKMGALVNPENFSLLGAALAEWRNSPEVLIGIDYRKASLPLALALSAGITSMGGEVHYLGVSPTPVTSYLVKREEYDFGLSVTASHNPPEYSGVKVIERDGGLVSRREENKIEEKYNEVKSEKPWKRIDWKKIGTMIDRSDLMLDYFEIVSHIEISEGIREKLDIYVDPSGGAPCSISLELLRRLGVSRLKSVNSNPDPFFSWRNPEPSESNLSEFLSISKKGIGFAFDGDGDRLSLTLMGKMVSPEKLLAAIASVLLEEEGGGRIVTTVDCPLLIKEIVERKGGELILTRVGDVEVSEEMRGSSAVFGGEPNGSHIFPRNHLAPDGLFSSAFILWKFGEIVNEIDKMPTPKVIRGKVSSPEHKKEEIISKFIGSIEELGLDYTKIIRMDGVRIEGEDWWVLVRPSGTEEIIRITVEGERQIFDKVKRLLVKIAGED